MKLKHKSKVYLKNRIVHKGETDGEKYVTFSEHPEELQATVYSKSGMLTMGQTGYVQKYQKKMLLDDPFTVTSEDGLETFHLVDRDISLAAGDGICIYARPDQDPDYRIVAINPVGHLKIMLEKL